MEKYNTQQPIKLIKTPLVDSIYFDFRYCYIYFIPSDKVSNQQKEFIKIGECDYFHQIKQLFSKIDKIFSQKYPLKQIVHSGGDKYTFFFQKALNKSIEAVDLLNADPIILNSLKEIADIAEKFFNQTRTVSI